MQSSGSVRREKTLSADDTVKLPSYKHNVMLAKYGKMVTVLQ
jgi:hypothetical protein